jgi:hypothetical protein
MCCTCPCVAAHRSTQNPKFQNQLLRSGTCRGTLRGEEAMTLPNSCPDNLWCRQTCGREQKENHYHQPPTDGRPQCIYAPMNAPSNLWSEARHPQPWEAGPTWRLQRLRHGCSTKRNLSSAHCTHSHGHTFVGAKWSPVRAPEKQNKHPHIRTHQHRLISCHNTCVAWLCLQNRVPGSPGWEYLHLGVPLRQAAPYRHLPRGRRSLLPPASQGSVVFDRVSEDQAP